MLRACRACGGAPVAAASDHRCAFWSRPRARQCAEIPTPPR